MKLVQIRIDNNDHVALIVESKKQGFTSVAAYGRHLLISSLSKESVKASSQPAKPSQPMLAVDGHHYIIGTLTPTADGLWFNYHTTDLKRHHEAMAADATPEAMARAITLAGHLY